MLIKGKIYQDGLSGMTYLLLYISTLSLSSDNPGEGIRSHYVWLLGFELRTFGRAVSVLSI